MNVHRHLPGPEGGGAGFPSGHEHGAGQQEEMPASCWPLPCCCEMEMKASRKAINVKQEIAKRETVRARFNCFITILRILLKMKVQEKLFAQCTFSDGVIFSAAELSSGRLKLAVRRLQSGVADNKEGSGSSSWGHGCERTDNEGAKCRWGLSQRHLLTIRCL